VPLPGGSRAFIATQDGRIHAVDTANGNLLWSTLLPEVTTGAPAGIFTAYGGSYDYVLVGTSAPTNNHIYALDPGTGAVIDAFPGAADGVSNVGPIVGTASVDYTTGRVYFASHRGGALKSLWCLDLGPSSDALRLRWSRDLGADVDGSPVLRGGRVYVGDNNPGNWAVWSIPASTGVGGYSLRVGTSAVKGFLFPDRNGRDLYAATDSEVVGLTDDGTGLLQQKWAPITLNQPSVVLLRPGTSELYVGVSNYSGNASLLRIDAATGVVASSVSLEAGQKVVGAPSLDIGYSILHAGSELGVVYAVQLPF
jgi:outer membrane protein assembly factor BamB